MIINVRGCPGSGKSMIIKTVLDLYRHSGALEMESTPVIDPDHCYPVGYICRRLGDLDLYIPGHYESHLGGCGQIFRVLGSVYDIIRLRALLGNVLYEGPQFTSNDISHLAELNATNRVLVLCLNTPISVCVASIVARNGRPYASGAEHCASKQRAITAGISKLREASIHVEELSREETLSRVLKELSLI